MQIQSPSKKMFKIGLYVIAGLLAGLVAWKYKVGAEGQEIGELIINAFKNLSDSKIGQAVIAAWEIIKKAFANVVTAIKTLISGLNEKLTAGTIAATGFSIAIIGIGTAIIIAIMRVYQIFRGAASVLVELGDMIWRTGIAIRKLGNSAKKMARGLEVKNFAIAIAVLTGSLIALALFYRYYGDDLENAAFGIGVVMIALGSVIVGLSMLFSKIPTLANDLRIFMKAMTSFAYAIGILSVSMLIMNRIDPNAVADASGGLSIMILAIAAALKIMDVTGLKIDRSIKHAEALVIASFAIILLAKALKKMSQIQVDGQSLLNLVVMLKMTKMVLTSMTMLLVGLRLNPNAFGAAMGIVAMVAAMYGVFKMLQKFGEEELDWSKFGRIIAKLAGIMAVLAAFGVLLRLVGKTARDAGVGILALSAGFMILVAAFRLLKNEAFDDDKLKGFKKLGIVIVKLIAALLILTRINSKKIVGFGAILAMLGVLVIGLSVLTLMDSGKLIVAAISLGLVIFTISQVLKNATETSDTSKTGPIVGMVVAVAVIAAGLIILQRYKWYDVLSSAIAMSMCIMVIGLSIKTIGESNFKLEGILGMVAAVAVIAGSLFVLSKFSDGGSVLKAALALSMVIITISTALTFAANMVQNAAKGVGYMIFLSGAVGIIALSLGAAMRIMGDTNGIIKFAIAISIVTTIFAGAFALLGSGLSDVASGVIGMVTITASIVLIAMALGTAMRLMGSTEGVIKFALAISIVAAVFAGLVILLGALWVQAGIGSIILILISTGLLMAGVAAGIAAAAFAVLTACLPAFADGLLKVAAALPLVADGVAKFVTVTSASLIVGAANLSAAGFVLAYGVGFNIIAGFRIGILDGLATVVSLGADMASSFFGAFKAKLRIASPSKEFEWAGLQSVLGLKKGAEAGQSTASASGELLGNSALNGVLSKVKGFFGAGQTAGQNFSSGLISTISGTLSEYGLDWSSIGLFGGGYSEAEYKKLQDQLATAGINKRNYNYKYQALKNEKKGARLYQSQQIMDQYTQKYEDAKAALDAYEQKYSLGKYAKDEDDLWSDLEKEIEDSTSNTTTTDTNTGGGGGSSTKEEIKTVKTLTKYIKKARQEYTRLDEIVGSVQVSYKFGEDAVLQFATILALNAEGLDEYCDTAELNIEKLEKALADYEKSLKSSVSSSMKLFKKFDKGEIRSWEQLDDIFTSQQEGITEYMQYMQEAAARGIDPEFLKEISEMSMEEAYSWAELLATGTEDQIYKANMNFHLNKELTDMVPEAIATTVANAFYDKNKIYESVGANVVDGLMDGLRAEWLTVGTQMEEIPTEMIETTKDILGINSPSKVFKEIGQNCVLGFIVGVQSKIDGMLGSFDEFTSKDNIESMSARINNAVQSAIDLANGDLDNSIHIGVVLDDQTALSSLGNLRSSISGYTMSSALANDAMTKSSGQTDISSSPATVAPTTTYNYTQNNYSPKALPAIEIYRKTNRMLNLTAKWRTSND